MNIRIDNRKKTANRDGQEYGHIYPFEGKSDDYQYPNEDKRVGYHANDPDDDKTTEELYNVQIEEVNAPTNQEPAIPVVKFDDSKILEDHRQRSYRIRTKPQVYDKMDLSPETYALPSNPREDEIDNIKDSNVNFSDSVSKEQRTDLTTPAGRSSLVVENTDFQINDQIEDSEMGLKGKVAAIGRGMLSIVWNDNTRERMSFSDASKFLKKSYVDAAQEQVDPLNTPPFPKSKIEEKVDNALSSIEASEDEEDDSPIDIEKVKLQRQVNELKAQVNEIDIQKIKQKASSELINLMQKKGMIGESQEDVDLQMAAIMAMDDQAFEAYKKAILGTKANEIAEIEAMLEDEEDPDIEIEDGQEYALAREAMKKTTKAPTRSSDGIEMGDTSFFEKGGLANFKGTIGDFSGQSSSISSDAVPRKLAASAQERKGIQRKADSGLDFSNFSNLQGLTTPINIPNKDLTTRGKFDELFSGMDWSGVPKKGSNLRIGR